jgi:hypothetical protein
MVEEVRDSQQDVLTSHFCTLPLPNFEGHSATAVHRYRHFATVNDELNSVTFKCGRKAVSAKEVAL